MDESLHLEVRFDSMFTWICAHFTVEKKHILTFLLQNSLQLIRKSGWVLINSLALTFYYDETLLNFK